MAGRLQLHYFVSNFEKSITTSFRMLRWGFESYSIFIINDSPDTGGYIEYSFDGEFVNGRLYPGEWRVMDYVEQKETHLRGQSGGESFRLEVY